MATIHHQLAVAAPIGRVYAALSSAAGISTWWDRQTAVDTAHGQVLEHSPGPQHGTVRLRVVDRVADARVEWECISTHPVHSPAHAWTGTRFVFELSDGDSAAATIERDCGATGADLTTIDFRQTGYDADSPFAGFNNFAWALVLGNLKRVCESNTS